VEVAVKIVRVELALAVGPFAGSDAWRKIEREVRKSIAAVDWPPGSGSFTLHDQSGKKRGEGSGVKPIKAKCMENLERLGWKLEDQRIDATKVVGERRFAVEWETGNISSSHRSMNRMALGMLKDTLFGGLVILPTRAMALYLTDRVGNFEELAPYFPLWAALPVKEGVLGVVSIEHDAVSKKSPRIPKGTDGRARQ
jgi:hypothetical protein